MRRRPGPQPPAPPVELRRWRLREWWNPRIDGRPPPWTEYDTGEQRFEFHAAKAVDRYTEARRAAGVRG